MTLEARHAPRHLVEGLRTASGAKKRAAKPPRRGLARELLDPPSAVRRSAREDDGGGGGVRDFRHFKERTELRRRHGDPALARGERRHRRERRAGEAPPEIVQ